MSYGKVNGFIKILKKIKTKDSDGFIVESTEVLHSIRAYREGRHGNETWANRASFTSATDLFRFRIIPKFEVTTSMIIECDGSLFDIYSVEDVKGRGMYIEVLAKKVEPING